MTRTRLDLLVVDRGLAESRSLAQRLIMAGQVKVDDQVVYKPATQVPNEANIVLDQGPRFVSRGGEKLQAAVEEFNIQIDGRICADVGASTGGFTDCLLQNGARRVYAIDVAKGQLHWKMRTDDRVIPVESTNARYLNELPEVVDLVVIDASFISLRLLLPTVIRWFNPPGGEVVALVKPQFEAGREEADRGKGVIRDPAVHQRVLDEVQEFAVGLGLELSGLIESPLKGPKGNTEFLVLFIVPSGTTASS